MSVKNQSARIANDPEVESIHGNTISLNMNLLTTENPVFSCWLFWCSILIIKMLVMSFFTGLRRIMKKTESGDSFKKADIIMGKLRLLWNLFAPITKFGKFIQLAFARLKVWHSFHYFLSICFCGQAFVNAEDAALNKVTELTPNDPDVERVRRAHLNDLENILPYLIISLAYITTDPNKTAARILFRIVAVARIVHTLVYAFRPVPQPTRAIVFNIAMGITIFMAMYTAVKSAKFI